MKPRDWTGEHIGKATVIGLEGPRAERYNQSLWRVRCGCGEECLRTGECLRQCRRDGRTVLCDKCYLGPDANAGHLSAAARAVAQIRELRPRPPVRIVPARKAPEPPPLQLSLIQSARPLRLVPPHVQAGWISGYGERHESCAKYSACLNACRLAGQAQCPKGARGPGGCYVERGRDDS